MAKAKETAKTTAQGFRLREQTGSFYDPETGFVITRSEVVKIDKSSAGIKTLSAIQAGGLIEVSTSPKEEESKKDNE